MAAVSVTTEPMETACANAALYRLSEF